MLYVAIDIGCIECGEDSAVLGIFTDKEKAESVLNDHAQRQAENWHGQHYFEIYEIEAVNKENKVEY